MSWLNIIFAGPNAHRYGLYIAVLLLLTELFILPKQLVGFLSHSKSIRCNCSSISQQSYPSPIQSPRLSLVGNGDIANPRHNFPHLFHQELSRTEPKIHVGWQIRNRSETVRVLGFGDIPGLNGKVK